MSNQINTDHLKRCIDVLEASYLGLKQQDNANDSLHYDIYRNSVIKSFEMCIEQSGKLLRKKLIPYFANSKEVYKLTYKELFKTALQHNLISENHAKRWFNYRDNRNNTTHDYGELFAIETLTLIAQFIIDARELEHVIASP